MCTLFLTTFHWLFRRNTLKRNLIYSYFIFLLFHKHLFSPELPRAAHLRKTSCFEKITACVIETMFVTLPLVQSRWIKQEEKRANKSSTNQNKIATVLRPYLNDWKKYLTTFQVVVLCKSSCKSTYCNSWILASVILCKSSSKMHMQFF